MLYFFVLFHFSPDCLVVRTGPKQEQDLQELLDDPSMTAYIIRSEP